MVQHVDLEGVPGAIPYANMGVLDAYTQFVLFWLTCTTRPEP